MSDLLLEYTCTSRASLLGDVLDDTEPPVGENLCPTCFIFVSRSTFGLFDRAEEVPLDAFVTDDTTENDWDEESTSDFKEVTPQNIDENPPKNPIVVRNPIFNGCNWSLHECQINSSFCSICKCITRIHDDWHSAHFCGSLSHKDAGEVTIQSSGGRMYRSHRVTNEGYNDNGEWTTEDVSNIILHLAGISLSAKSPPPHLDIFGPTIWFQQLESTECTVDNFLAAVDNQDDHSKCDFKHYWGRLRPQDINLRLLEYWKDRCVELHGNACSPTVIDHEPIAKIRLIDVNSRCLVEQPGSADYVALSYVWGRGNVTRLLTSNVHALYQVGSLSVNSIHLPPTIADAITVTASIGERYIWIDSLCIIQDDDSDRGHYLSVMDLIYTHAKVTIVDGAGRGAEDGLSGVRSHTRSPPQEPFEGARGELLVQSFQPTGNGQSVNYLGESVWSTRAWTFQERVFSRRAFVFTPEQVYWECQLATWCEDGNWELMHPPLFREEGILDDVDLTRIIERGGADELSFEESFRRLVQHYTDRALSVPSDHLHAFDGILKVLQHTFEVPFYWGLPVRYFVNALCWPEHADTLEQLIKVDGQHLLTNPDKTWSGKVPLPSWSWVGWICKVRWYECGDALDEESDVRIRVFILTHLGNLRELTSEDDFELQDSLPYPELKRAVEKKHIPRLFFTDLRRHIAIHFWTLATNVDIGRQMVETESGETTNKLLLKQKNRSFKIWKQLHRPSVPDNQWAQVGAILISRSSTHHYYDKEPRLVIMLVCWQSDIAYKVGMVVMLESEWLALEEKECRVISLC